MNNPLPKLPAALLVLIFGALVFTEVGQAQDSIADAREKREAVREEKADAASSLNAEQAKLDVLAAALEDMNAVVAEQEAIVEGARVAVAAAEAVIAERDAEIQATQAEIDGLKGRIRERAVESYVTGGELDADNMLASADLNDSVRRNALLDSVNADAADLLDLLRAAEEDLDFARVEAEIAAEEAEAERQRLGGVLALLEGQRDIQAELVAEVEVRRNTWQAEYDEFLANEQALSSFIAQKQREEALARAAANATTSVRSDVSRDGFRWPAAGSITSGFGSRIHPIFKTSRMHNGVDIDANSGAPIYASKGGTVLVSDSRQGSGQTVVLDHGNGVSTWYFHMSERAASVGETVDAGEIIGYVGSTGWSTGPHLHFEVRVDGLPKDPLIFLP
ncbi:MAG: peptidoglycan DD-metalloendopeptidase family protein [Actinomycetia bacterium]|nr:peptidoglycan DD-metalloendopeptidase family protein [Actinomycetes bacterium]